MFTVYSEDAFGTNTRRKLQEFETNAEAWRFIQETHNTNQLAVFQDGRKRAVFTWLRVGNEPVPNKPGYGRDVWNLCKWEGTFTYAFGSWKPTGVQAAGVGAGRVVRTV